MVFLVNPIISPDFGLFLWTFLIFVVFATLLGKFAFKPIVNALREREQGIADALASADKARAEMQNMQSENESLLRKAQEERTAMSAKQKSSATALWQKHATKPKPKRKKL